ncbi:methyltransferase dimerization domain-containing protein [uncultured Ruegeria sp.]|uniref:methyltransferase n=1 Tax=uncultured Ruegeria sp. TaxID=259304 RepID=UPI0026124CB6|nr:methyltransferase dimerization domain-containing protein [uncultured Ruegeria sp.]
MEQEPSLHPIPQLLSNHMATKYVFVASSLELFEAIASGHQTLQALAKQLDVPSRTLWIIADALVAIGFLEKVEDQYHNTQLTATFLSGQPGKDLRPILKLWDTVVYPQWGTLEASVRLNKRTLGFPEFSPGQRHIFDMGVTTLTVPSPEALAQKYDFSTHKKVLDMVAGMGVFLKTALATRPNISGTLVEMPETAQIARQNLAETPFSDLFEVDIPDGHDAVIVANIVHMFSPEKNLMLLNRIRQRVVEGAKLLLIGFGLTPHIQSRHLQRLWWPSFKSQRVRAMSIA